MSEQIQSITIIGKRWFNRGPGNTYFSAVGMVNGKTVATIDYEYGYGNQYEQSMTDALERLGFMPGREHYKNGMTEAPWQYCQRNGIAYSATASDVARKKDL